jgi:uridylate kinase
MKCVVSLGGSQINPGKINIKLLKELRKILLKSKHEFVIVCGGGTIARDYIKAGKELQTSSVKLDIIGIKATELNAELVSAALKANRLNSLEQIASSKEKIIVTNGLFPGVTSDFDCVVIADLINAELVINLSNVKGVYDKDPKEKGARLLKTLSYNKLIKLASEYELGIGANFIFDLAACKLASRANIKLVFTQGLKNFEAVINKKKFTGSVVK